MTGPAAVPGAFRWTDRSFLLIGVAGLLLFLGVATRSPVALFVGLPLLVVPFATASFAPSELHGADLAWEELGSGEDVRIEGALTGALGRHAGDLVVELRPPAGARPTGPMRVERRPDGLRFSVRWRLLEPTIVRVAPPRIVWRDPLGLCEREVPGVRPELTLNRYPAELRRLGAIRLERTISLPGETLSRRIGRAGEFYGVREAAPDEPWGRINWRASARFGRLLANDYQTELTGDVVLLLDQRPSSTDPALDARLLGIARAGVYGIADSLLHSKVRVGYAAFGEFLDAVPLSSGRIHRARVLRAITAGRLSQVAGPAERCAHSLRRFFRPGVTTVVVSAWSGEPSGELVPYLRRQGFPPLLVSPSPLPLLRGTGNLSPAAEAIARRVELVERRVRLAETWRHAPVVDWDDYWSLEGLARFLRRPARRRSL